MSFFNKIFSQALRFHFMENKIENIEMFKKENKLHYNPIVCI
jgi:hypothetical protein